jgi:hypothetical protein
LRLAGLPLLLRVAVKQKKIAWADQKNYFPSACIERYSCDNEMKHKHNNDHLSA